MGKEEEVIIIELANRPNQPNPRGPMSCHVNHQGKKKKKVLSYQSRREPLRLTFIQCHRHPSNPIHESIVKTRPYPLCIPLTLNSPPNRRRASRSQSSQHFFSLARPFALSGPRQNKRSPEYGYLPTYRYPYSKHQPFYCLSFKNHPTSPLETLLVSYLWNF